MIDIDFFVIELSTEVVCNLRSIDMDLPGSVLSVRVVDVEM